MKFFNKIYLLIALLGFSIFSSCKDEKMMEEISDMGYVQVRILPEMTTRSITLETLGDIKKVELSLLYKDMKVVQTVTMSGIVDAIDYGITSERLQLAAGEYTLLSYRLLGSVVLGESEPQELMTIYPTEAAYFNIVQGQIHELDLEVSTKLRGKVSFMLEKDFTNYQEEMDKVNNETRATTAAPELFRYDLMRDVDIYVKKKGSNERPALLSLTSYATNAERFRHTDTISLEAGDYEITSYMLYTNNRVEVILANDLTDVYFTVEPNQMNRASMAIRYPENMYAIKDYIALYNIWRALDGENWQYTGYYYPSNANWRFKNRPIDEWGAQPGVTMNSRGRVISVNVGSFNPCGDVPSCLGDLTELNNLWLGMNSDVEIVDIMDESLFYSLDRSILVDEGVDIIEERENIVREELSIRHHQKHKYTLLDESERVIKTNFARTFSNKYISNNTITTKTGIVSPKPKTNRIKSIPAEIGNLKNLTVLYISNGFVSELPETLADLPKLTDVELYNCNFTEFPEVLAKMQKLIFLNFSANLSIPEDKFNKGIDNFLATSPELQIFFATDNNLSEFPMNILKATKMGYVDFSYNYLTELPNLERALAPVKAFFDYNKITKIHDKFCNTDDIENISFSNNFLTEIPNLFGNGLGSETKYTMSSVNFTANQITSFAPGFAGIRTSTLDLTSNPLGRGGRLFPDALADSKSKISYLIMDQCELDTLPNSAFKNMTILEALQVKGNRLKNFPEVFTVEEMPYLSGLDISYNAFRSLPIQPLYIHNLNKLFMLSQHDLDRKGNPYRCMPELVSGLNKHPALKYLDVSGNDIQRISAGDFPGGLFGFNIRNNPNIEVTVSTVACNYIGLGYYSFLYDATQNIQGCAYIELED